MAVFILEDALSVWMNLDKHLLFIWLPISLDELSSLIHLEQRTVNSSSRQILRLVSVFINTRDEQPEKQQMFAQVCPDK